MSKEQDERRQNRGEMAAALRALCSAKAWKADAPKQPKRVKPRERCSVRIASTISAVATGITLFSLPFCIWFAWWINANDPSTGKITSTPGVVVGSIFVGIAMWIMGSAVLLCWIIECDWFVGLNKRGA